MSKYLQPCEYLPHDKPMVLLDEVLFIDENTARTKCIVDDEHVLKPFLDEKGVSTFITLELFAQSVGIWSGYFAKENGQTTCPLGMVLGGRDYKNKEEYFKIGTTLIIEVNKIMYDDTIGSFEGTITDEATGEVLSSGKVNVIKVTEGQHSQLFKR